MKSVAGLTSPGHRRLPGGVGPITKEAPKAELRERQTLKVPRALALQAQQQSASRAATEARAHAHAKAENLVELRAQGTETSKQRYDTRLIDLICNELRAEFGGETNASRAANSDVPRVTPTATPAVQVAPLAPAAAKQEAAVKAASAAELIEKIEAFVKSQRPGIAITLDGSLGARVEIERLGPKEVAIRLVGKNGPPKPEDISRIRDEMRVRGLKVGALSVA
ncbi:MAG: hypothetical protein IPJ65_13340 [Archangiaceae bacterium]|nr:hypothetical protein [Archangiaceae bacterium]